jgi:hypothetical protein
MNRTVLMLKTLVAFVIPSAFVRALADADYRLQLSRDKQLSSAGPNYQETRRQEMVDKVHKRLGLLRRRVLKAAACVASAVLIGMVANWLSLLTCLRAPKSVSTVFSLFFFAWATLGRLGWAGQSYKGDTVVERFDQVLFWGSYWLGTFFGTLAAT